MIRILSATAPSVSPLRTLERDELHLIGVEVQDGARGRAVHPAAPFPRVDDERLAPGPAVAAVRAPVHDERVRLDRPRLHLPNVVDEQNLSAADLEAVGRLEELDPDPRGR